jgi:hypothetical protein
VPAGAVFITILLLPLALQPTVGFGLSNSILPLALQPTVGFGLSNNILPFFFYLSPALSLFSLLALEDLFLLPLFILSWVFPFVSSLPVLG